MKLKIGILATILSLMLVGCTNPDTKEPEENLSNGNEVQDNIDSETEETEEESTEEENTEEESPVAEEEKKEDFIIYTVDVDDTEKIIEFKTVELNKDASIEDKLKSLCEVLEKEYFKDANAKIEFKSIDENNIATIDLVNQSAWHQHFQGSTGGFISQETIIETLLQRDYSGEWIEGLNVLIDGKNEEVFDHAPFVSTFYRKK